MIGRLEAVRPNSIGCCVHFFNDVCVSGGCAPVYTLPSALPVPAGTNTCGVPMVPMVPVCAYGAGVPTITCVGCVARVGRHTRCVCRALVCWSGAKQIITSGAGAGL